MSNDARTGEFAEAALAIVAREGLAALSFRTVAAESGWSLGAVQKAFATKQQLVEVTFAHAQRKVALDASEAPGEPTLHVWLVNLVMATLPLDAERRAAVVISSAFADRAAIDPVIAAAAAESDAAIRSQLIRLFAWRRAEGELISHASDEQLARAILATATGLASQLLYDPAPEGDVESLVNTTVGALLG